MTEAAAHSWTQVYFPNYGWVDFEPTSGRVLVEHDTSSPYAQARPDFQTDYTAPVLSSASQMFEQNWLIIPTFILLVGVAVPGCLLLDTLILRRSEPTRMIYILYQRLIYLAAFHWLVNDARHDAKSTRCLVAGFVCRSRGFTSCLVMATDSICHPFHCGALCADDLWGTGIERERSGRCYPKLASIPFAACGGYIVDCFAGKAQRNSRRKRTTNWEKPKLRIEPGRPKSIRRVPFVVSAAPQKVVHNTAPFSPQFVFA